MPEEINRVVVDHLSELLFCSSGQGVQQLVREGVEKPCIDVGDVMLDAFNSFTPDARQMAAPEFLGASQFAIVTIHRPSNTDNPERLGRIVEELGRLELDCIWPVHPRLSEGLRQGDLPPNLRCVSPLSYFEMLAALQACNCVITDSGGLQKEAYWAKKPCVTVRGETEWVETLDGGWNQLWDQADRPLRSALDRKPTTAWRPLYGDGKASERIVEAVRQHLL
jgi:UDP-N-acetylglucosamine 2-epimerase